MKQRNTRQMCKIFSSQTCGVPRVPKEVSAESLVRTAEQTSSYVAAADDDDYLAVRRSRCPPIKSTWGRSSTATERREVARGLPGAAAAPHLSILS